MPPSPSWTVPGKAIFDFHHPLGLWKKNHNPAHSDSRSELQAERANRKPRAGSDGVESHTRRNWDEQTAQPCVIVLVTPTINSEVKMAAIEARRQSRSPEPEQGFLVNRSGPMQRAGVVARKSGHPAYSRSR